MEVAGPVVLALGDPGKCSLANAACKYNPAKYDV
jgi:hypothetical protein